MYKTGVAFIFLMIVAASGNAQYYYKDIVSNRQVQADMIAYKQNNVRTVTLKSFDDNGEESRGFFCEKKISKDFRKTSLFTRADRATASEFSSSFDPQGRLLNTYDSSVMSVTTIRYTYDAKQRVSRIESSVHAKDEDYETRIIEEHIYSYDEDDKPEKMLLVKNKRDTVVILFATDDNGNTAIEKDTKNGATYYYYYDAKNMLTDIVRGTDSQKRLKPDYIFDYNAAGLITQMTSVEEGSSNYFIWKYNYDNGMRVKARCFSNERRLMGTIEYANK